MPAFRADKFSEPIVISDSSDEEQLRTPRTPSNWRMKQVLKSVERNHKKSKNEKANIKSQKSNLNYDEFERHIDTSKVVNSTKVPDFYKEEPSNCSDEKNFLENDSSFERLMQGLYGNYYSNKKNQILKKPKGKIEEKPKSLRKKLLQDPEEEIVTYSNPYLDSEIKKSEKVLKSLEIERRNRHLESSYISRLKNLCDDDSDEYNKSLIGRKLDFDANYSKDNISDGELQPKSPESIIDKIKLLNDARKKTTKDPKLEGQVRDNKVSSDVIKRIRPKHGTPISLNKEDKSPVEKGMKKDKLVKPKPADCIEDKIKNLINNIDNIKLNDVGKKNTNEIRLKGQDSNKKTIPRSVQSVKPKGVTSETEHFLLSLSDQVPMSECHPSAKVFRATFKKTKEELAKKLFVIFNEHVFKNQLPENLTLEWSERLVSTAGHCTCRKTISASVIVKWEAKIVLSSKVLSVPDRLRDTLLHEMCHAATFIIDHVNDGHGPKWRAWTAKADRAFPRLPAVKVCHNYDIVAKYEYRCTNCGYSFGRHRKSVDVERKRCGFCVGKFEILINKVTKDGRSKIIPTTPKKEPTGFALFVKENYANFKTPDRKHGDVMRVLSEKFKIASLSKE